MSMMHPERLWITTVSYLSQQFGIHFGEIGRARKIFRPIPLRMVNLVKMTLCKKTYGEERLWVILSKRTNAQRIRLFSLKPQHITSFTVPITVSTKLLIRYYFFESTILAFIALVVSSYCNLSKWNEHTKFNDDWQHNLHFIRRGGLLVHLDQYGLLEQDSHVQRRYFHSCTSFCDLVSVHSHGCNLYCCWKVWWAC